MFLFLLSCIYDVGLQRVNPVILQAQHFVSVEMPSNHRQRRDFWGERCLQFLYIFVLGEGEKTFQGKVVKNFARNTNMHKIWKLLGTIYFPHSTTVRHQTLQFY